MKSIIISLGVAAGLAIAGSAMATDMPAVAKKNNCIACHTVDKKLVGPAWMDVAKKYKGDPAAFDKLSAKVRAGGSGVWGPVPMPPNPKVSPEDMKELITFILDLAK